MALPGGPELLLRYPAQRAGGTAAAGGDTRKGRTVRYIERIAVLNLKDREIVTLKVLDGMTSREIGKVLGMTGAAVQKRYERALRKLKEQEEAHGE